MNEISWSKKEKGIARHIFKRAYERECIELINKVKDLAGMIETPEDMWELHDFLSEKRKETDGKYDYRFSVMIFVLGRLLSEGWITFDDFEGLTNDKIEKIKEFAKLLNNSKS